MAFPKPEINRRNGTEFYIKVQNGGSEIRVTFASPPNDVGWYCYLGTFLFVTTGA